jgi:hypothetical protein
MTAGGRHGTGQIATTADGTHGGIAMIGTIAMIGAGASSVVDARRPIGPPDCC